jgi:hypothetical protein
MGMVDISLSAAILAFIIHRPWHDFKASIGTILAAASFLTIEPMFVKAHGGKDGRKEQPWVFHKCCVAELAD